jgi:hypothetical protein
MLDDAVGIDAEVGGQPAMRACEVAQAASFVAALDAAIADLRARIGEAERRWALRQSRAAGELDMPERLVRLHSQLVEATRLLDHCTHLGCP